MDTFYWVFVEKLHILSSPENKARREGQTASFCCKVAGIPPPDSYQWYGIVLYHCILSKDYMFYFMKRGLREIYIYVVSSNISFY